ncbi:MAG: hypothetical protein HQK83_15480 [Fibrobacteria bacterium]|nr:hypothetical protein [Fibrobacteria bacterium]
MKENNAFIMNEVQLILAEKRTSFALLRTGIAVFALPLSVLSFLVIMSKSYDASEVLHFIIPLVLLNLGLIVLGIYLITRAVFKIHRYDKMIANLKRKHTVLMRIVD